MPVRSGHSIIIVRLSWGSITLSVLWDENLTAWKGISGQGSDMEVKLWAKKLRKTLKGRESNKDACSSFFFFFFLLIKSVFNFRQAQAYMPWSYAELEVCCVYKKTPKNNLCFNWKHIILACPNALWQLCVSYCFSVISGRRQQAGEMPNKWDHNSFKKIIPPNSHLKVTDSQNCSLFYLHKKVSQVKVDIFAGTVISPCNAANINSLQCKLLKGRKMRFREAYHLYHIVWSPRGRLRQNPELILFYLHFFDLH